jgi:hypothetical protein
MDLQEAKILLETKRRGSGPLRFAYVGQRRWINGHPATITSVWGEYYVSDFPIEMASWVYDSVDLRGCSEDLVEAAKKLGISYLT